MVSYREIREADNALIADIIRKNLEKYKLDIPGTVYFDDNLNHLSNYYLAKKDKRFYLIAVEEEELVGGIGLAECDLFPECAELQKLYLTDKVKGRRLGYELVKRIEEKARELGYKRMYLETHTNLDIAIHLYEKCGYKEISRPSEVVHSTMNKFYLKEF